MFKELSTELNAKMPITCELEEKFGKVAEEALRKADRQTFALYMCACALAMMLDGVILGPDGEVVFVRNRNDGNDVSVN